MYTLFFKIFAWFWAAMALIVLTLFTLAELFSQRPQPQLLGKSVAVYSATAAGIYEREGKEALDSYLNLLGETGETRAHLFDQTGAEISGRSAPPALASFAAQIARSGTPGFRDENRDWIFARPARGPSGRSYVLVGAMSRPIPPSRFSNSLRAMQILAVLLIVGVVCYWLARYLTAPIVTLRRATRRLAAGDLGARVGAAGGRRRDELADLGRDFDLMAGRIEALIGAQRRLLGDISHELRSPLARLNLALGLARQRAGGAAASALDRIERESNRLNDLIGHLLTLTRLESGEGSGASETVDLARLVAEIAADADFEARGRHRSVSLTGDDYCVTEGDERLLRSAIENVVRNAVHYTAEGTAVEIELDYAGSAEEAIIRVRDHGAGVPAESLASLFRPFYRVGDARDRQSGGVGLGLAITERAVRLHGGTVTAANAPGGGLIVEISLPTSPAAIPASQS